MLYSCLFVLYTLLMHCVVCPTLPRAGMRASGCQHYDMT